MAPRSATHHNDGVGPIAAGLLDGSAFWSPDHLSESAWLAHAPFMFWLIGAHRPGVFVELGTHTGFSFFAACQAITRHGTGTRAYAVDTWRGDEHSGAYGEEVFLRAYRYAERHYAGFASLLRGTFDETLPYFEDGSIDLLHIDGRHYYDDVRHDLEAWLPKLSPRGVVLLHDTNVRERGFGVSRLFEEARTRYRGFEFVHGHGMGVLAVGAASSTDVDALLAAEPRSELESTVRAMYARLGDVIEQTWRREVAELDGLGAAQELAERTRELDQLRTDVERIRAERAAAERAAETPSADTAATTDAGAGQAGAVTAAAATTTDPGAYPGVWALVRSPVGIRSIPAALTRMWRDRRLVRHSGIFDGAWYREAYPDIGAAHLDPVTHYLRHGAAEGRDPGPAFSTRGYLGRYPDVDEHATNPLVHFLRHGRAEGRLTTLPEVIEGPEAVVVTSFGMLQGRFPDLAPLRVFRSTPAVRRVSLVIDRVDAGSPYGTAGAAIVVAAMLATHRQAALRVVTRQEPADRSSLVRTLRLHGVDSPDQIEFEFADPTSSGGYLPDGAGDLFLTASWSTTRAALRTLPVGQVVYLLQEDERLRYPPGDDRIRCAEAMATDGLRCIVRSSVLLDHLVADGFGDLGQRGRSFEAAFPAELYRSEVTPPASPVEMLFHARADQPGDLFFRGLEAIDLAIDTGVLDLDQVHLTFVGRDLEPITLGGGAMPRIVSDLAWAEYRDLLSRVDVGLCLQDTPQTGYPLLDLIAAGAVAVTNRSGGRREAANPAGVVCVDADAPSLVAGIGARMALAADRSLRPARAAGSGVLRSWSDAIGPLLGSGFLG